MTLEAASEHSGAADIGDRVRVRLDSDCDGGESPHFPTEDGAEGKITAYQAGRDHPYFVLFQGRPVRGVLSGQPKTVLGRRYAVSELELLDADRV